MPGDEDDAQAAGRRHRERLRHERLAVDRRLGARLVAAPAGSVNSARPCSSVVAVARRAADRHAAPAGPATLLPIASRTTRTVTVPSAAPAPESPGRGSATGSGMSCALRRWRRERHEQRPTPKAQRPDAAASHDAASSFAPQLLAEPRVGDRSCVPHVRARRVQAGLAGVATGAAGGSADRRLSPTPLRNLLLDLLAIAAPASSCRIRPRRARAQAAAHLGEVLLGHLPHRAIELELLDRAQHQRLLALERRARAAAEHLRAVGSSLPTSAAASVRQRGEADGGGGEDREAEQDDRRPATGRAT